MDSAEYVLIIVNLIAGFVFAIPIAKIFDKLNRKQKSFLRYFAILIGVYFIECIAIVMGMGIPVFSIGLAFIWGILFGFWLWSRISRDKILKTSFFPPQADSIPVCQHFLLF
ncbi:MAG: hypothetical protein ACETVX_04470 [bacterium]